MPETKAAQLSSVNEIDYGFHSDDDYDYWKVTVAGVTFKNGRKSRQTILKKIFFRDEPFNKDECHSCTLRRGEYEGEPSFAVCVHDDIIGFIPREKVQYFYDNFYRCDGITTIRVFSEHDIIGARVVVRFRRNADETSKDAPQEVTTKAVQLHGGYGYIREYDVERMMRDAKITEIYEGTSEVQRMVISGALLK